MAKETIRNIKLGIFVIGGTLLLILALYAIGNKRNLFGSTFKIHAAFYKVNGLMKGHNVRFAGIDVGTVDQIEIINDTTVMVTMIIEKKIQKHIQKNAIASIGADGLMGNKLVNINSIPLLSENIEEDDTLQALPLIELDDAMRTLNTTNENLKNMMINLEDITAKLNQQNSLWSLLMDTLMADNVKATIVNIKAMSSQSASISNDLKGFTLDIKHGKGSLSTLLYDTLLSSRLNQIIDQFENFSDTATIISGDISQIIHEVKMGKGTMGTLLTDTILVNDLSKSIKNIEKGTNLLNEDLEALRHSWPFKKYFKKKKTSPSALPAAELPANR